MFISLDLRAVLCFYCRANYVVMAVDIIYNFHNMRVAWLSITSSSYKFISYMA